MPKLSEGVLISHLFLGHGMKGGEVPGSAASMLSEGTETQHIVLLCALDRSFLRMTRFLLTKISSSTQFALLAMLKSEMLPTKFCEYVKGGRASCSKDSTIFLDNETFAKMDTFGDVSGSPQAECMAAAARDGPSGMSISFADYIKESPETLCAFFLSL